MSPEEKSSQLEGQSPDENSSQLEGHSQLDDPSDLANFLALGLAKIAVTRREIIKMYAIYGHFEAGNCKTAWCQTCRDASSPICDYLRSA